MHNRGVRRESPVNVQLFLRLPERVVMEQRFHMRRLTGVEALLEGNSILRSVQDGPGRIADLARGLIQSPRWPAWTAATLESAGVWHDGFSRLFYLVC